MRFSKARVVGALVFAATLSFASIPFAQAQQNDTCTGAALAGRDEAIGIGASIDYGDSLHEVALYRLLTGIDATPLKSELQALNWDGPSDDTLLSETDTGSADAAGPFDPLLIPAAELEANHDSYLRYYHTQDWLKRSGLRSYRPERGGPENAADWWLRDDADPVYRENDFAGWLQAMAASDTFHRNYRIAGRGWYRPLISSWTYFDPKKWDVANYDRVTSLALDKWQQDGKPVWAAVVFSRLRTDQAEADGLIDWFYQLHAQVKACAATKEETVLYSLFRFHTLRLLFMRAAYQDDRQYYDKAMRLMADTIPGNRPGGSVSDENAATRAALLMAGYDKDRQIFYPAADDILSGNIPQAQAWRDLRWASAGSFDDYIKLAAGQEPQSHELAILNGLSTAALYRLLEANAFTPDIRNKLAETGWLRSYLLNQPSLNRQFLTYIADHHDALKEDAKALLAASDADRGKEDLLFLLRHMDLSVEIDTDWNQRALWCNGIGVDAYEATMADIMGPVLRMAEIPQAERWYNINYWHEYGYYDLAAPSPAFEGANPGERFPRWSGVSYLLVPGDNVGAVNYTELSQLGHLPLPRDLLIGRVLDWARSERSSFEKLQAFFGITGDQRVAEALHLAIRDMRNICRIGDPNRMSRAAWIVLHANPRWKAWAQKTPYWYN
jgi:hypothetical protein